MSHLTELRVGAWYWDAETRHAFKLISVEAETVTVADAKGTVRAVNRLLFERDMIEAEG